MMHAYFFSLTMILDMTWDRPAAEGAKLVYEIANEDNA